MNTLLLGNFRVAIRMILSIICEADPDTNPVKPQLFYSFIHLAGLASRIWDNCCWQYHGCTIAKIEIPTTKNLAIVPLEDDDIFSFIAVCYELQPDCALEQVW